MLSSISWDDSTDFEKEVSLLTNFSFNYKLFYWWVELQGQLLKFSKIFSCGMLEFTPTKPPQEDPILCDIYMFEKSIFPIICIILKL
jgi:hypothetical protein